MILPTEAEMEAYDKAHFDPDYDAYLTEQARHSECGTWGICSVGTPDACPMVMELDCWTCHRTSLVVALGPVAQPRFDPTQTYRLACGHTVI